MRTRHFDTELSAMLISSCPEKRIAETFGYSLGIGAALMIRQRDVGRDVVEEKRRR